MKLSIIIPVCNGGDGFAHCLRAVESARAGRRGLAEIADGLQVARYPFETELIVVDDGSTDDSPQAARAAGAIVFSTPGGRGPAAARNLGARAATGDCLFFVDADVALHADALRLAAEAFRADPSLEACFGSYDDAPAAPNFLSQYKNLFHHYTHQHARTEAATFWTGCGAIRAAAYHALGGLDEKTYRRPSIEDIDLGYRLQRRGGKIRLIKEMQGTHLKRWTAGSLLRSDIFERGIPWTVLLWREGLAARSGARQRAVSQRNRGSGAACSGARQCAVSQRNGDSGAALLDLNLQTANRVSVVAAGLLLLSLLGLPFTPSLWPLPLLCAGALAWLNRDLYRFFLRKRGAWFMLAAIPWHWLYYLYNSLSFGLGTLQYFLRGAQAVNADGTLARPLQDA